jgi:hypothetical protein
MVARRSVLVAVGLAVAAVLGACGSGGGASSTTTSTTAPPTGVVAVVLGPFRATGGTDAEAAVLLVAGCAALAPADRGGDSSSFNDYFTDLFDGGPTGDTVRRDRHDVDRALEAACAAHPGDVEGFLAAVGTTLALSPQDVDAAIVSACDGYRTRRRANAGDEYAPAPLDERVLAVLGAVGIDRSRAEDLIGAYCGPT